MQIIRGKIPCAKKCVLYGPEGIGKSTFAAKFPEPIFIDTEGSTKDMDIARTKPPSSWQMLLDQVGYFIGHPEELKTLVIDTADWAEQLCSVVVCLKYQKNGIEDFGYGKGYTYLYEEFGKLLNLLTELVEQKGIHVILTAHAKMRKFEQPDEMGSYDRWEMKLTKQVAPMVKEWADMVLFANYKTIVINVDGQGAQKGKNKAQGGKRVMYTTHHTCWDAKNRYGLPDEVPFEYSVIAPIIESTVKQSDQKPAPQIQKQETVHKPEPVQQELILNKPEQEQQNQVPDYIVLQYSKEENVPKALMDLMISNKVTEWDIQNAVGKKGYFPSDVPIEKYPENFIQGCLIAAWPKVFAMIRETRKNLDEEIPFN
ncbi:MAG: ATP-binding protein [Clostridiales bacterium]|nr:ATP-binding protein [Clostridiales bacterium]